MAKQMRTFVIVFLAFTLSIGNFPVLLTVGDKESSKVKAAELGKIPLNFTPTDTVINSDKPIIYFTDINNKKVCSLNYETGELKFLSFTLPTERLTFANGELYVTLLKSGHQAYSNGTEQGAVAVIDGDNLTVKKQFDVDIDPYDIEVNKQGYIYLFSGTYPSNKVKSYSREGGQALSTSVITYKSIAQINPITDKIYTIDNPNIMPISMSSLEAREGKFIYNFRQEYDERNNINQCYFRISPDGTYIFNGSGNIYRTSRIEKYDMTYIDSLNTRFSDIAFNLNLNKFYAAINSNEIGIYDYNNFTLRGSYYTSGTIRKLFYQNNNIISVSQDSSDKYFIEKISESKMLTDAGIDADNSKVTIDYSDANRNVIKAAVYDARRNKVYALDSKFGNLLVMDATTNKLEKTVYLTYEPKALTVSENGNKLYIANEDDKYLVSEIDLNTFENTRNLSFTVNKDRAEKVTFMGIYQESNKILVTDGSDLQRLLVFDVNTFQKIEYGSPVDFVAGITFDEGGNYFYKLQLGQAILKRYSMDGDSIKEVDSSGEKNNGDGAYGNVRIFLAPKQGKIIYQTKIVDINNLSLGVSGYFYESILAVDEKNNLAVGSSNIYDINTKQAIRSMPMHDSNVMFFDKDGKLHYFKNTTMSSIDPLAPVGKLSLQYSSITEGAKEIPPNLPIVIEFDSNVEVAEPYNIFISGINGRNFGARVLSQDKKLVIIPKNVTYNSDITLTINKNIINDDAGNKFNDEIVIKYRTGNEFNRIAGLDRYDTSVKVSNEWPSSEYVVLASGQDFPDALSAAPLAKKYGAPILLTNPKELLPKTEEEISRLGTSKIFIVGGYGSVSQEIENKLSSKGIKITRLSGQNRYETSLAVANFIGSKGELFIVAGSNFPDALSIASFAAATETPILLTEKNTVSRGLQKFISDNGIKKTYIIGGTGAISSNIEEQMPNSERIWGDNRYETNINVLKRFPFYFGVSIIASGQGFADALSGSALAGTALSPIIIIDESIAQDDKIMNQLKELSGNIGMKYTIGGEGVVPSHILDKVFKKQ